MELRLMVEAHNQPDHELAVEVEPVHQVSEVITALANHLRIDPVRLGLFNRRTGQWLDPNRPISGTSLRTGDRVALWDPKTPIPSRSAGRARDAVIDLLVVGGPSAGLRVPLPAGEHKVGSSRYSGILLEDPTLSKVHLTVDINALGRVSVADAGSDSGTFLAGQRLTKRAVEVKPGQQVVIGRTLLAFQRHGDAPQAGADGAAKERGAAVEFNRPPRVALNPPTTAFMLPEPPSNQSRHGLQLGSALPMTGMGLAMYFLTGRQLYALLFAFMGPAMIIFTLIEMLFGTSVVFGGQARRYRKQIAQVAGQMAQAGEEEKTYAEATAPDAATLLDRARMLDTSIWERRPDSPDWLRLRVGWADQPSTVSVEVEREGGDPRLRAEAMRLGQRHDTIPLAPMTVSLKQAGVVGLSGDQHFVGAMARWMCLQLAILHSPQDLTLCAIMPEAERPEWSWFGWLPHVGGDTVPGSLVASDRASAQSLIDRLTGLVEARQGSSSLGQAQQTTPAVVLFIREGVTLSRGAVSNLLEKGPAVGVHAIWVGTHGHGLPGECGAVVEAEPGRFTPVITIPGKGEQSRGGGADGISFEAALDAALALAPVKDISSRIRQAEVPNRVNMMDLMGLREDPEGAMMQYWIKDRSQPEARDLSARWGMAGAGEPIDVSIRFDGPHGLVGGMTGSGKSETLQALVASMATRYSPRSLTFLLVDYKGGAAFKDCVDLPHTVGFVTDLDGHLVLRALVSLRAELRRREHILQAVGAKDLIDMEQEHPDTAPPSLLIIVDEFAALATELPEFVEGMVDVAQRGRSLGIHLILATQRPAGVISDKIRANIPLRVSLRFADESDSKDVINTNDAARPGLPPGRCFARVRGQVIEFQAGYVGGLNTAGASGPAPVSVKDLEMGEIVKASGPRRSGPRQEGMTDLQRLVKATQLVNERLAIPPQVRPWLPALPDVIPLHTMPPAERQAGGGPRAVLGMADDPSNQAQVPASFGIDEDGTLLVYGSSGSGKTTALRSIAVSMAYAAPPDELHMYALDFATRGLKPLEALPHFGAVIGGDEIERTTRLLNMLRGEVDRRKALLADAGAGSLPELLASRPGQRLPRILTLLDGMSGFFQAFDTMTLAPYMDLLKVLVAEGRPLGVGFIITSDRYTGPMIQMSSQTSRRLLLRLASEDDYGLIGLPRQVYIGAHLGPGRGFVDKGMDIQVPIVGEDPSGSGQAFAIAALGEDLRSRHGAGSVPRIDILPRELGRGSLPRPTAPLEAVVGIDDTTLQPVRVDFSEGHFVLAGPRRSGRTTTLATFVTSLAQGPGAPQLHLLAPRPRNPLAGLPIWASTAVGMAACEEAVTRLADAIRGGQVNGSIVVVVDDGEELMNGALDLEWLAQSGREAGVRVLVAIENSAAQRAFGGWLGAIQKDRQGLLLDPDTAMDAGIVGASRLPPRSGAWPAGRAYLVRQGVVELVQIAGN